MKIGSLQSAVTRWPFFVFLGGSMFCLLSSGICYLFSCHSHYLNIQLLRMDYVGIMVLIITSFFPPICCIFQCEPHWQLIFLGEITAMGMFTVVTLLAPSLSYITGTLFYVSRIPERLKPGWFDLAGHSHQIIHVFVIMGALAHYGTTLLLLQWLDRVGCDRTV